MKKLTLPEIILLLFFSLLLAGVQAADFIPVQLECEHKVNPLGINSAQPRFGWGIAAEAGSFMQGAYRINVASSLKKLENDEGDVWNSGKVVSGKNFLVPYEGPFLRSAQRYYWKVKIWDREGNVSEWSEAASFVTGIFEQDEWEDSPWIAYERLPDSMKVIPGVHGVGDELGEKAQKRAVIPYFRHDISFDQPVEEAFLFVSGLGHYDFYINGKKVGNDFLAPGWTDYQETCQYNTYDVTDYLQAGENALGAIVGTGFFYINRERYRKLVIAYGYPMLRAKLVMRFADGSEREVVTSGKWKTASSPITYTSIYGGEDYNANLEQPGWSRPGFDDSDWQQVLTAEGPGGQMTGQMDYPLQVMDTFALKNITSPSAGKYVYDFGQNASGIIHLKVQGEKGDTIRIWPAELLNEEGIPTQRASGGPYYFEYVLKGEGVEEWTPRFTYYGFRYALVEGAVPANESNDGNSAEILSLQFLHTRNSAPAVGKFACSNPLFNRIDELILWAIKSNLASVATDCPHREKLGWLEQVHLMGGSIKCNFDIFHLYNKTVNDMMEAQLPNGLVPDIAPEYVPFDEGFRDSPEWGSASVIIPWYLYQWYGDTGVLHRAYGMMKDYVAYLGTKADGHILSHGLGDWFDLGPENPGPSQLTPISLTATAMYYYDADILSKVAEVLGKEKDAQRYQTLADDIRTSFNEKFYNPQTHVYATGSQTSYAMPLFMGLVDEANKDAVFRNLVASIKAGNKALTAGDVGYRYLVRVLEEGGAAQLLYEMNNRDDVPGYGYQIARGATALTESWPALKYVSNNHMMLGHLMEWLYSGLAGIRQQEGSTGFRKIKIAPQMVDGIDWAEASYNAISGEIKVHWNKEKGGVTLKVDIPANTEAEIYLPVTDINKVTENGKPVKDRKWLKNTKTEDGKLVLDISSGSYDFYVNNKN